MGVRESRISTSPAIDPQHLLCLWETLWEESRPGRSSVTAMPDYAAAARAAAAAAMVEANGSLQTMPEGQQLDAASPPSALFVLDARTGHYVPTRKHQSVLSRHSSSSSGSFSRSWQRLLVSGAQPSQPSRASTLADACASPDPTTVMLSTSPDTFQAVATAAEPSTSALPLSTRFPVAPSPFSQPPATTTAAPFATPPAPQQPRRPASQLTHALRPPFTPASASSTTSPIAIPTPNPTTTPAPTMPIPIPSPSPRSSTSGQSKLVASSRPMPVPTPDTRRRSVHRSSPLHRPPSPSAAGAPAPIPNARRPSTASVVPHTPATTAVADADDDLDNLGCMEEYQEPLGTGRAFSSTQRRPVVAVRSRHTSDESGASGSTSQLRMAFISEGTRQPLLADRGERRPARLTLPPAGEEEEEAARGGRWRSATAAGDLTVRGAGLYAQFMQQQQQQALQEPAVAGRYAAKGRPAFRSEPIQAAIMASPPGSLRPSPSPSPPDLSCLPTPAPPRQPSSACPHPALAVASSSSSNPSSAAPPKPHPLPNPPTQPPPHAALLEEPETPLPDYVQRILSGGVSALQPLATTRAILPRKQPTPQPLPPPLASAPHAPQPLTQGSASAALHQQQPQPLTQGSASAALHQQQPQPLSQESASAALHRQRPQPPRSPAAAPPTAAAAPPDAPLQPAAPSQPQPLPPQSRAAVAAAAPQQPSAVGPSAATAAAALEPLAAHNTPSAAAAAGSLDRAYGQGKGPNSSQVSQRQQPTGWAAAPGSGAAHGSTGWFQAQQAPARPAAASVAPIDIRSQRGSIAKERSMSLLNEPPTLSTLTAAGVAAAVRQGSCGDLVQLALSGRASSWGQQFLAGSSNHSPVLV